MIQKKKQICLREKKNQKRSNANLHTTANGFKTSKLLVRCRKYFITPNLSQVKLMIIKKYI